MKMLGMGYSLRKYKRRPIRFLLYANLPEPLQKPDRIHARSSYGKIWGSGLA
ncbi:hypothetical protein LCGC14_0719700 [marine sediment metagenome]|uniref:Uncharacterized protein n=1 Tax=marine sediment metagenome TaxID=412755 RepID=A0A0F9TK81_9ZZZZ